MPDTVPFANSSFFQGFAVPAQRGVDLLAAIEASKVAVAALLSASTTPGPEGPQGIQGPAGVATAFGTTAGTAAQGNDSRITGAYPASNPAGYPTPAAFRATTGKLFYADFRAAPGATDTTALTAMFAAWVNEIIVLPPGTITMSSLAISVPEGKAMVIQGASPRSTLVLVIGSGINVTLAPNSGLDISGINFQRGQVGAGGNWSGTCITVTAAQAGLPCPVRIHDVDFTGGPTYFQTGIRLNDCQFPELRTIRWYSGLGDPASATFDGCAIVIAGSNAASNIFAVDADIIGLVVQGGYAGVRCIGGVQGVYITNFRIIGSIYGVYWPAVDADVAELLTCSQGHFNVTRAGVYASYLSWVSLNNILSLHNAPDTLGWCAFDLPECYLMTLSNLNCYGLGGGTAYPEIGVRYFATQARATQPSTITGCVFTSLKSWAVQLGGTVSHTQVSGCVADFTGGITAATAGNTLFANTRDGVFDVVDATSGINLSNAITKKGGTQTIAMPGTNISLRADGAVFVQNAAGTAPAQLVAGVVVCSGVSNSGGITAATGIGVFGHASPAAQPAAPVTLADVIAIIRGCGLSA